MAHELLEKIHRIIVPDKSQLEIETRFFIDSRKKCDVSHKSYTIDQTITIAKDLIEKYKDKQANVSQTINFINNSSVKQMVFVRGEQQKDKLTHYKKTVLTAPMFFLHNDMPPFKFSMNFETPTKEFAVSDAKFARIRLRYTIQLDDWQIDITLIKNIDDFNNPNILKSAKASMLFDITKETFIEKAPWVLADLIEFELEYTGKHINFSTNSLLIANEIFSGIVDKDSTEVDDISSIDKSKAEIGVVPGMGNALKSSKYQQLIYTIAKYIKPKQLSRFRSNDGLKQLSNQVIELNKNIYLGTVAKYIKDYYITDKVDGSRAIIYITDKIDDSFAVTDKLINLQLSSNNGVCIFDTELYEDVYYIFDVMVWEGETIIDLPFNERLKYIGKATETFPILKSKPFIKLTDEYAKQIIAFKKEIKPYEIDGIILTPANGMYNTMKVYKYKPVEKMSIDFYIKKCPDKLFGIHPYVTSSGTLYLLFCGISKFVFERLNMKFLKHYEDIFPSVNTRQLPNYFPIQFQPSNNTYSYIFVSDNDKLDGEVGEFVLSTGRTEDNTKTKSSSNTTPNTMPTWKLTKIRTDRKIEVARGNYFGNNYKVAEMTWLSYEVPLSIENISQVDNYFQENDNPLQKPSRSFNSFVKSQIFNQFKNTSWIIDMASGKGQDLFRYAGINTNNIVFLEIDETALLELITRKHEFSMSTDARNKMYIQTQRLDLNDDYKKNIDALESIYIPQIGVDLIICNFAFHYLIADKKHLINIIKFISNYLKPGGRFIFTAFDGKDVIQLLNSNNGEWTVKVKTNAGKPNDKTTDVIKYSIKKQYKTSMLEPIGQKIDVLLPFSSSEYYSEYLVNIDYISEEFKNYGFTLETNQSFSEYLETYKELNSYNWKLMDDTDKQYVGLYHYYCFYKNKPAEKATTSGGRKKR